MTRIASSARPPRGRSLGLTYIEYLHLVYDRAEPSLLRTLRDVEEKGGLLKAWAYGESVTEVLAACRERLAPEYVALASPGNQASDNPEQSAAA
jgi:hypothetical protein